MRLMVCLRERQLAHYHHSHYLVGPQLTGLAEVQKHHNTPVPAQQPTWQGNPALLQAQLLHHTALVCSLLRKCLPLTQQLTLLKTATILLWNIDCQATRDLAASLLQYYIPLRSRRPFWSQPLLCWAPASRPHYPWHALCCRTAYLHPATHLAGHRI